MRAGNVRVVVGSALLWAWGFLCFLSPALFPERSGVEASIGLEYGFFASQASVVVCACLVMLASRWRRFIVRRGAFFVAALLVALTTLVLAWAVRASALGAIVACGVVDGGAVMLLGVAWGARYSLGSRRMRSLVVLSFLVAYLLYLVVAHVPGPASVAVVCLLPLASWALWRSDAAARHELSSEVFPVRAGGDEGAAPGELMAGLWEARVLPWRAMSVLVAATFVGNLMASTVMGGSYASVDSLFFGGILVCACIATMALVPLTARRGALSVDGVYRITVTFTAVGLVGVMVFGAAAIPVGGALVQGSAFFLQVLVFLVVTQGTQESGLSPLLSFSVGQALISGVVFAGNVVGKQVYALFGSGEFVLDVMCGLGLLALFFMLVGRAGAPHEAAEPAPERAVADAPATADPEAVVLERAARFSQSHGLTKREAEVLGYLARGRTLPYIADALFVTTGTVKTHTTHIYRKLAVNSRQELLDLLDAFE
ncbi:helix-turn-helix transcriptional regulator [Eggerthella sinensis]|uniref:helix-turn-helix transcriptional regulator n=1 Tax=Eggerthella sinensis TaxID=242230 RepID=UPI001D089145|nr:LuxR C-terminal-related transcriptional regulator [Eggerthella sinensis]MCB7036348.1 LuxR C-terminal-related transcriptional regulator [Eggerthella sinensis]